MPLCPIAFAALVALASVPAVAANPKKEIRAAPQKSPPPELPPLLLPPAPAAKPAPKPAPPAEPQLGIYRLVPPGTADDPAMQSIEDTFMDVAQASKRYRNVVKLAKPPKLCELEDDNCFALLGGFQQLDQVLVGEILKLQNGAAVKVRLIDVQKGKAIGQKALTAQTDDKSEIKSWAEALACDLINNTTCKGQAMIDVDLPDMRVIIDNMQYPRTGKNPETFAVPLGVHNVRVAIDQRTSVERKLLVSREPPSKPVLYARQLPGGGIILMRSLDLQMNASGKRDLAASVNTADLKETKWTKPVGYAVAGLGIVAGAIGVYEGLHSKSLTNDANARYTSQNGYLQRDLSQIDSAKSAAGTANILFVVGAVLLASGLTMSFAF
jgi:hypothetical protein